MSHRNRVRALTEGEEVRGKVNAWCTGGVRIEVMDWLLDAKRSRIQGEIRMKKLQSPRYEPLPLAGLEQTGLDNLAIA